MDHCELALAEYGRLCGGSAGPQEEVSRTARGADISAWIDRFVCPVAEELLSKPRFREHATWWIRRLTPGADSPERALINRLDNVLVQSASLLVELASEPQLYDRLARLGPYQEGLPPDRQPLEPIGLSDVRAVASRPWRNLVSTWDYFRPTAELNLAGPPSQRLAQFTPAVEPMLRPLGDYIGRMTLLH